MVSREGREGAASDPDKTRMAKCGQRLKLGDKHGKTS